MTTIQPRTVSSPSIAPRTTSSAAIQSRTISTSAMASRVSTSTNIHYWAYNEPSVIYNAPLISYNYSNTRGDMSIRSITETIMRGR